ncbi:MAG: tetratricopeptide repeat protein [Bernardetiaceae bacterium]|jgi:tetratricopeptide (TPR) repeat protein|nr:tetratricopeptide repeat protein [Bernardetiaceae bacterium]
MKKLFLLIGALVIGFNHWAGANCGECKNPEGRFCWGDDPGKTKEKWVLVSDAIKMNDLSNDAAANLEFLLTNHANLSENLYINAIKFYEAREAKETDPAKKAALEEKVLSLYDKRMQCYGEKPDVMERKARKYYDYYIDRPEKHQELYDFYNNFLAKYGASSSLSSSYLYLIDLGCKMKLENKLAEDKLLERYDLLLPELDKKLNEATTPEDKDKWTKAKEQVEGLIQGCVTIDCDFVKRNFAPKLKANPADKDMAKKIMAYMVRGKCTDDPLFKEALLISTNAEPSFIGYKYLGVFAIKDGKTAEAIEFYKKALEAAKDDVSNTDKAEMCYDISQMYRQSGKLKDAEDWLKKAADYDPSFNNKIWSLKGDQYMGMHSSCKGKNALESRYIFLAAYDAYQKAGSSQGMANAKAQFPSIEDIFTFGPSSGNVKEGSTVTVPCLGGVTTTLRRR